MILLNRLIFYNLLNIRIFFINHLNFLSIILLILVLIPVYILRNLLLLVSFLIVYLVLTVPAFTLSRDPPRNCLIARKINLIILSALLRLILIIYHSLASLSPDSFLHQRLIWRITVRVWGLIFLRDRWVGCEVVQHCVFNAVATVVQDLVSRSKFKLLPRLRLFWRSDGADVNGECRCPHLIISMIWSLFEELWLTISEANEWNWNPRKLLGISRKTLVLQIGCSFSKHACDADSSFLSEKDSLILYLLDHVKRGVLHFGNNSLLSLL